MSAPGRSELVRYLVSRELSERRSLTIAGMSSSAYRYVPRPDHNVELREMICALENRHKRYGRGHDLSEASAGRALGELQAGGAHVSIGQPQVRRRRPEKIPPAERQPLLRPAAANEVWSIDFVFDRTAEGRAIKHYRRYRWANRRCRLWHQCHSRSMAVHTIPRSDDSRYCQASSR